MIGGNPDLIKAGQKLTLTVDRGPAPDASGPAPRPMQPGDWSRASEQVLTELRECELDERGAIDRLGEDGFADTLAHYLGEAFDTALGVQTANAPGPESCVELGKPESQVVIEQVLSIPGSGSIAKLLARQVGKRLGLKKLGEFITEQAVKSELKDANERAHE